MEVSDPTTSYCFPDFDLDFETRGLRICFFQATIIEGSYPIDGENISVAQAFLHIHIQLATTMHSSVYGGAIYSRTAFIFKSIGISHPYSGFHQCPIYFELEPKNSIPFQVLTCEHGTPNSELGFVKQVYPVELLHFPLVTTGQGHGIVPRSSYSIFQQNKWKYVISSIPKYSKSGGKLHRAFLPSAFIKCKPQ